MHLKTKFLVGCSLVLTMIAVLGFSSIAQLATATRITKIAIEEHATIDRADAVAVQVAWLRDSLRSGDPSLYRNDQLFDPIRKEAVLITDWLERASAYDAGDRKAELDLQARIRSQLALAVQRAVADRSDPQGARSSADVLENLHQSLADVSKLMPLAARRHVVDVGERLATRLYWTCFLLLLALAVSAVVHVKQFRLLVRPLLTLRDDLRSSASREFKDEIRSQGEPEFREVAGRFNGLVRELAELYRTLEEKVVARSRELVRSERLASVGFLAAGVAHEINNPLSVICGYAELAAKSLRSVLLGDGSDAENEARTLSAALDAQVIVQEESFRCKEITSRLLSLARNDRDGRRPLLLDDVARQVSVLVKGLRNYSDRRVLLDFKQKESLTIFANLTELKQVLLNLTVNALEAVPPERGEVRIGGRRRGPWVELSVEDNGKGMAPATLQHVFEPFYTAKRGAGEPGTGLGLSITNAIVENHGGRIEAESDGLGRGSRFTIRFPAIDESGGPAA